MSLIPDVDWSVEDDPLPAIIVEKISLKEDRISDVDELAVVVWVFAAERLYVGETELMIFVMMTHSKIKGGYCK